MAEVMTVETIVEAYWQMKGYWTRLRYPLQIKSKGPGDSSRGWSDIDLLAYNPEENSLVISESKVQGVKHQLWTFPKEANQPAAEIEKKYFKFMKYIPHIIESKMIFTNFKGMVDELIIQLVSNYYIKDEVKEKVQRMFCTEIRKKIDHRKKIIRHENIRLDTTFEIICEIIKMEKAKEQGRRYGNPVLDIVREFNRYLNRSVKQTNSRDIRDYFKNKLLNALNIND